MKLPPFNLFPLTKNCLYYQSRPTNSPPGLDRMERVVRVRPATAIR